MRISLQSRTHESTRGKPLTNLFTKNGGVTLYEKGIGQLRGEFVAFADHHIDVRCESAGDIHRRFTATRIALFGIFALAFKKAKDDRAMFVTVSVDYDPWWVDEIKPDRGGKVLQFAKRVAAQSAS